MHEQRGNTDAKAEKNADTPASLSMLLNAVSHGDPKPYNIGIEFLDSTRKDNEMPTTFVEYYAAVEDGKES